MIGYYALRRHLRLSPGSGDGDGGGNGNPPGDGDDKGADDKGDDDADDAPEDLSGLKAALKRERELRKDRERDARTLRQEKDAREKKDRDDAAETARKNGEWESIATTAQKERDEEKTKRETLEASVIADRKATAVRIEAMKLVFYDPDEAVSLIDLNAIEVDDDGKPKEVKKAVKDLATAKPHLVNTTGEPPREGMPKTPGRQGNNQAYSASRSYVTDTYSPRNKS